MIIVPISIVVGAIAMSIFSPIPLIGPILAGILVGLMVKTMNQALLSGFLSGTVTGMLIGFIITAFTTLIGAAIGAGKGFVVGGLLGVLIGGGVFVSSLYFGLLGLVGGAIGIYLKKKLSEKPRISLEKLDR